MGKEGSIREFPEAAGIVCHDIPNAGEVLVGRYMPRGALVQCRMPQQVGRGLGSGGGPFGLPGDGRGIVAEGVRASPAMG